MDLKNLADKLADLERLEKSLTQTSNKVPGEQPTMDPKADVQAMKQALNVIRSPITPTAPTPPQASQQSDNTDQSTNVPPEKQDLQQKSKPGEPVGEEMIEEETSKERYIRQAKEKVAKDPSYIYQVDPRVRADIEASMTPRQRNTAKIQKNLARAYADNDEQAIAKWTAELEKRKSADNKPATTTTDKPATTTTDKPATSTTDKPATSTTDKPATSTTDKPEDKKGKSKMDTTGPWYRGTEGDYVIKPGDTLYKIAKQTGIPMSQLQKMNNIQNANKIVAGAKLKTTTSPQQSEKPASANNNNNFVFDPISKEMVPADSSQAREINTLTVSDNPEDGAPVTTVDLSAEEKARRQRNKDALDNPTTVDRLTRKEKNAENNKTDQAAQPRDASTVPDAARGVRTTPEVNPDTGLSTVPGKLKSAGGDTNVNTASQDEYAWRAKNPNWNMTSKQYPGAGNWDPQTGRSKTDIEQGKQNWDAIQNTFKKWFGKKDPDTGASKDPEANKAPEVKSIDTLRHSADSKDTDTAQAARNEIKNRMQAGTSKENLISLNNVVKELLEK